MKKEKLKKIREALANLGMNRSHAWRYTKRIEETGSIVDEARTGYFKAIYAETGLTPNDLVKYK